MDAMGAQERHDFETGDYGTYWDDDYSDSNGDDTVASKLNALSLIHI